MALDTNLVAFWELDDLTDGVGANDLAGAHQGYVAGKVGNAADFEADNSQSVSIADNSDLSMSDIDASWQAWVQLESKSGFRTIFAKDDVGTEREYGLGYRTDNDRFFFYVSGDGVNVTLLDDAVLGSPSLSTWYHLIAWHDAALNQIGLVINAGTPTTTAHTTGVRNGADGFVIGAARIASPSSFWDGPIDQVGFWKNRVLSSQDQTDLFNGGNGLSLAAMAGGGGRTTKNTRAFPLGMEIGMNLGGQL